MKHPIDFIEHIIDILQYILVQKRATTKPSRCSSSVLLASLYPSSACCPPSISINSFAIDADKVSDVAANRNLSAKLPAVEQAITEMPPRDGFPRLFVRAAVCAQIACYPRLHPLRCARDLSPQWGEAKKPTLPPSGHEKIILAQPERSRRSRGDSGRRSLRRCASSSSWATDRRHRLHARHIDLVQLLDPMQDRIEARLRAAALPPR